MATLQSFVNKLPPIFANRYTTGGYFLTWINELLEEIQERGFMPSVRKETGVVVVNDEWIVKPTDFISLDMISSPIDRRAQYRVEEVNNKFRLMDFQFEDEASGDQVTASSFDDYTTTTIDAVLTGYSADELENYLFYITAGTYAGTGYVLSGNAASTGGQTRLNFLHTLSAALDGTKVTAARLVPPAYYLMMKYRAKFTEVSAIGDEVPLDNDFEKRIVPAWLRWKCEEHVSAVSQETVYWRGEVERILVSIEAGRNSRPARPPKGRRLIGFEKDSSVYYHPNSGTFS